MGEFKLSKRCCQTRKPSARVDPSRSRKPYIFGLRALPVWILPLGIALRKTRKSLYLRVGCEQLCTRWFGQGRGDDGLWALTVYMTYGPTCHGHVSLYKEYLLACKGRSVLTSLQRECSEKYKTCGIITVFTVFLVRNTTVLTFRHRASCILGQAFHYSPESAFYIQCGSNMTATDLCVNKPHKSRSYLNHLVFNQQIYFIIWYLLDRTSLI